ncbi:hypothetical protein V7S43_009959 [Phytophthora oleae]|uniref:BZIP domain-containing protein n=1 Tax=Phytophthora oleae TaxID=2107226 RepID=A0ABD3FGW7_9STRA
MTTTDTEFLAQVEDLLASCDLPLLPSFEDNIAEQTLPTLQERKDNATSKNQVSGWQTKASRRILDVVARHEIEKAKDRKRRRDYRERRRIERDNLQQEIEKLTEELQKAKRNKRNLTLSAWEMLAQRQFAARRSSEDHQRQLHTAIDVQAGIMEEFRRLVHERIDNLDSNPDENRCTASKIKRVRFEATNTEIFVGYIKELASVFAQTDRALQESKLESTEPNWNGPIETWDEDVDTGYFQFRGKITLSFDFEEICRYRWHTAHLLDLQESRELYDVVDDPENTQALKFRRTTHLTSGGLASVLRRLVIRRYESKERMVLVWRVFSEGEGVFNGMHADETGWGVISPTERSSRTGTVLRTCVKNTPMHFNNAAVHDRAVKQFSEGLIRWGHENNEKATLGLEKLLLRGD